MAQLSVFLHNLIRDLLLALVLFHACTTTFAIYLTAPVQSAVLGVSLFSLVTLLSLHSRRLEDAEQTKQAETDARCDKLLCGIKGMVSKRNLLQENVSFLLLVVEHHARKYRHLLAQHMGLQEELRQAHARADAAQAEGQQKDLLIASLQHCCRQVQQVALQSKVQSTGDALQLPQAAPEQVAQQEPSLCMYDMDGPVMTRTPGHSELGSQPPTGAVLTPKAAVVPHLTASPAQSQVQTADKGQHKVACSAGCMSNKSSGSGSAHSEQQPEVQHTVLREQEATSGAMCHSLTATIEAPQHDADDSTAGSASHHETAGSVEGLYLGEPVTALARSASEVLSTCSEAASTAELAMVNGSSADVEADDTEAACVMSPSLIAAIQRDINTSQQGY